MDDFSAFVPNVSFEKIPIKNLVSDQAYQRNLSERHVERTSEQFDLYQINPVKVSRRNGINYVFNGQHTIEIVAKVSGSRNTPVWCMIYDDLDYTHEADIFANQQKNVKPLLPYEIFMANIEAGNNDQLTIQALVQSYGLRLAPTKAPGAICAVSTLENIYRKYGYHILSRTLRLIIGTWEGEDNSFGGNVLNAVAKLCYIYGDSINDENFKEKLGLVSIKQLLRTAKERRAGSLGVAEQIIIEYNGRKKTGARLSMTKLYSKENSATVDAEDESVESEEMLIDEGEENENNGVTELFAGEEGFYNTV